MRCVADDVEGQAEAFATVRSPEIVPAGSELGVGRSPYAIMQALSFSFTINDPVPDCLKNRPQPLNFDREIESVRFALRAGNLRPGDLVAVGSVSGRNVRPVEIAIACRELGIKTIGFTSLAYTAKVTSAHPSGKKLADVVDVVIDNGAPFGDAAVSIAGYDFDLMPVSGVSMTVGGWLI